MKKVRFEIEVEDEILNSYCTSDEIWRNAKAKVYLQKDSITGNYQVLECVEEKTDDRNYANVMVFLLPKNAVVIDDNVEQRDLADEIADLNDTLYKQYEDVANSLRELTNKIENITVNSGGGSISEKTLLDALQIVAKYKLDNL